MKKLTCILLSCSLTLAGTVLAQKPDEHASPNPNAAVEKGKGHAPESAKPKPHAAEPKPDAASTKPATAPAEKHSAKSDLAAPTKEKTETAVKSVPSESTQLKAPTDSVTTTAPAVDKHAAKVSKEEKQKAVDTAKATPEPKATPAAKNAPESKATATAKPTATVNAKATPASKMSATPAPTATAAASVSAPTPPVPVPSATPAASVGASPVAGASASGASAQVAPPNPAAPKKPEPQKVQQIRTQQANFRAQPRPDRVPPVTFQANYRIQNVDSWQGPQYEVYRSYRPERHDRDFYHSHYRRVELIAGGYYYWNAGYWYPAWGYSPREEYYAYDAPIYVGERAEPPDRVISEVQAALKDMGYYKGEVDGLLGPLTREALIGYQTDQGLTRTAVMDEPTLDSLGMG